MVVFSKACRVGGIWTGPSLVYVYRGRRSTRERECWSRLWARSLQQSLDSSWMSVSGRGDMGETVEGKSSDGSCGKLSKRHHSREPAGLMTGDTRRHRTSNDSTSHNIAFCSISRQLSVPRCHHVSICSSQ